MIIAITPSLNAARRSLPMTLSLLVQTARHYQGQQSKLAIYWNNHHHLLHTVTRVDGLILWANSFLLFWLSLIPAATAWMGENFLVPIPTAFYGGILFMPAIAYYLLQKAILRKQGSESLLANALGTDIKGKISPVLYAAAIMMAFVSPWISIAIYAMVAVMWLVPDRQIENVLREKGK
jgi:uncharacterized membrane protein